MLEIIGLVAIVLLAVWLVGGLAAGVVGGLMGLVGAIMGAVFGIIGFVLKVIFGLVFFVLKAGMMLILVGLAALALVWLLFRWVFGRGKKAPREAWRSEWREKCSRRDGIYGKMDDSLRRAERRMARLEQAIAERMRRHHRESW